MPLIPALERQRGRWISEFKASLVYRVSSRTARTIQRNPVSKKQNKNKTKQKTTKKNNLTNSG
jgi:Sec-independent protein translocase protein TatA